MTRLDWSRYRAVSGWGDEVDASRLSRSADPVDRAMGEALARDYAAFTPHADDPLPLWLAMLGWAAWGFIFLGFIASVVGILWVLLAYVAPAIPVLVARNIQWGGVIVAGWL